MANVHHHVKFHANRPNRSGDTAIFYFLRWRLSTVLDWFYTHLDHYEEYLVVFVTVQNLVGICAVVLIIC